MKRKLTASLLLTLVAISLAGCHKASTSTPATPVPVDVRIAQAVQIVAVTNQGCSTALVNLSQAGLVSQADSKKIAAYLTGVATMTEGIAKILKQDSTVPWATKAVQIQNLALSLVPPTGFKYLGMANADQWTAFTTALNVVESTIQSIVIIVKSQ